MKALRRSPRRPKAKSASLRFVAGTIRVQRRELRQLLKSGRNHAAAVFAEARAQAAGETELDVTAFPVENRWNLDAELTGLESQTGEGHEPGGDDRR